MKDCPLTAILTTEDTKEKRLRRKIRRPENDAGKEIFSFLAWWRLTTKKSWAPDFSLQLFCVPSTINSSYFFVPEERERKKEKGLHHFSKASNFFHCQSVREGDDDRKWMGLARIEIDISIAAPKDPCPRSSMVQKQRSGMRETHLFFVRSSLSFVRFLSRIMYFFFLFTCHNGLAPHFSF